MDLMNKVHKQTSKENINESKRVKNQGLCCIKINRKSKHKKASFTVSEEEDSNSMSLLDNKPRGIPIIRNFLSNIKSHCVYDKVQRISGEKQYTGAEQKSSDKLNANVNDIIQEVKNNGDQNSIPVKNNMKNQLYKLQLCESKLNDLFGFQGTNGIKNLNHLSERNLTTHDINSILEILDERIDSIRWKAESANYLQWLGVFNSPNGKQCAIPGITASPPNPYLSSTRLTDAEIRLTLADHQKLCTTDSVDDELRKVLRTTEFNNWSHSDSMLMRLVREMYTELNLVEPHLPIKVDDLDAWMQAIYKHYNQVPFHNFKHAFMVTQMSYVLIRRGNLEKLLDKFDQCVLITAAICHDLDHPGFNNSYQINARTQLALRYNDRSPLENHHASTAFSILYCEGLNPFNFDSQTDINFREAIIKCILATDMSSHNEILTAFTEKVLNHKEEMLCIDEETGKPKWVIDKLTRYLVMSILIKVSDISNESRPINVAAEWIDRLLEEFFVQSDFEKKSNLPYAPFMDRSQVSKPASQCSFIQFVILPLFKSLCDLIPELEPIIITPALNQLDYYTKLLPESEKID